MPHQGDERSATNKKKERTKKDRKDKSFRLVRKVHLPKSRASWLGLEWHFSILIVTIEDLLIRTLSTVVIARWDHAGVITRRDIGGVTQPNPLDKPAM